MEITLSHSNGCTGSKIETKKFNDTSIVYCSECFRYATILAECEHIFQPIAMILENGSIQIRKYCTVCHIITAKSEKHSEYDLTKLPHKKLSDYSKYFYTKLEAERKLSENFRIELNQKTNEYNKREYSIYLHSDFWAEKRKEVLKRDNNQCQICFKAAEHVHHLSYIHRGKEYTFELVSLCKNCHKLYHEASNTIYEEFA